VNIISLIHKLILRKAYLYIGFFCLFYINSYSQDQKVSDSLENIYSKNEYKENEELNLLKALSINETNAEKKLKFSLKLIELAKKNDSVSYLYTGYFQKGNALLLKSDLVEALVSLFNAAKIANNKNFKNNNGNINIAIADVYSTLGDHSNAILYYNKSLKILEKGEDSITLASAQFNLGDEYYRQNKLDSAQYYYNKSSKIFRDLNIEMGIAYNMGNEGLIYTKKNKFIKAEKNLNEAIEILSKLGYYSPVCDYLVALSDIYFKKGNDKKALLYALKSFQLAKKHGFKDQISNASLKASTLYKKLNNVSKSYYYYKTHIIYKDSVQNIKAIQKSANIRSKYVISQKQIEVDLLNAQKKTQQIIAISIGVALFLITLLALGLFKRNKYIAKTSKIIEKEKARSDDLLLNILPKEIANELKENNRVEAKKYESVSVLFTDFKGFTNFSENLEPKELVRSVDFYFSKFDEIIAKYELEKIKTIGDSYMCAGGLPFENKAHVFKIIQASLEIIKFVDEVKNLDLKHFTPFDVRIGINTGPVVAGVVGTKKFAYDVWGDTVNVASRMESSAEIGKINISENTYKLIKEDFNCTYRGIIKVKNRSSLKMYYVDGIKESKTT